MFITEIKNILLRDLTRLEKELLEFEREESIWLKAGSIKNSPGHLTLHLCGNLRHFIGHVLGRSSYTRKRELEFNSEPVQRDQLISGIHITRSEIISALDSLEESDVFTNYPIDVFKKEMTTQFFLIHLCGHLNYHLGQINYLRRSLS